MYQATVKVDNEPDKISIGTTERPWKQRFSSHKTFFKQSMQKYHNTIKLYMGTEGWVEVFVKKLFVCMEGSKECNLLLNEKSNIIALVD